MRKNGLLFKLNHFTVTITEKARDRLLNGFGELSNLNGLSHRASLSSESESEWMHFLSLSPGSLSLPELEDTKTCFSGRESVKSTSLPRFAN